MEAKSRIAVVPVKAFTIALLTLAAFVLLAGGYAIRVATYSAPASVHASTVTSEPATATGGTRSGSAPSCTWVSTRKGC